MPEPMENRDEELVSLIARCAIRDQAALKALLDKLGPYLNSVAYRILRSQELCDEVLQEAFLQVWSNAESYRPHLSKPLTWIISIVRYRALDRLEKEKRLDDNIEFHEDEPVGTETSSDEPEKDAEMSNLRKQITQCLGTLSDRMKESVQLAYIYGYSREEIAERFSANTNTVKSWLKRGSERLKQCLDVEQSQN